ncbi:MULTISPECIES: acyl-CoA dehydrogenase family protein [Sphingosinicellaceae]|uniref:acyl-CoA dehydrogenase family protein n=1 Tax=Sphingosinicellaceae TaxID=2820280 RepID=UPI001C1E1645|nr:MULTISPECIES: acyl-CoA dehydrogenase family protein [Polymorphobacter]QYE35998.1 acyl-CoA dehydrogenase family protein [Polymorphobacter sp. PAMC 29334]UAJ10430.1 acyl-CoA dehydrogenase family protein [Polymorphobacter megasporae]
MTDTLETFRQETRDWLAANCPPEMRLPIASDADVCWGGRHATLTGPQRLWLDRMGAKGWTVPEWPVAYGGGGLSKDEAKVLASEMRAIRARSPLSSFGIWMLGPALLKYGSEEQKLEHLPKIARGEIRWCQGYSEPGAGSDLAALRTSAILDGDDYIVNGQKVWTSYADKADWIFCLVRTDPAAPKHLGISFLLFDMASPGVTTSPIKLISGYSPFCQTFFDDVRVPKGNLMGTAGKGWDIAKYLLTHEREMIGDLDDGRRSLSQIAVKALGEDGVAPLRTDIVRHEINALAFGLTMERVKDEAKAGQGVGALSSMLKYYGTELNKQRQELLMSVAGSDGLVWEGPGKGEGDLSRHWLRSRANSIEGGTSEVQLNIIAKRVLQLPGA